MTRKSLLSAELIEAILDLSYPILQLVLPPHLSAKPIPRQL